MWYLEKIVFGHISNTINISGKRTFFVITMKKILFGISHWLSILINCKIIEKNIFLLSIWKEQNYQHFGQKDLFLWSLGKIRFFCDQYKKIVFFGNISKTINISGKRPFFCNHYEKKRFLAFLWSIWKDQNYQHIVQKALFCDHYEKIFFWPYIVDNKNFRQ